MIGAIKLQEPKLQGKESLQDVLSFLESGESPLDLTKGRKKIVGQKSGQVSTHQR